MATNQLSGGGLQDSAGNIIANGRMVFRLSAPATDSTGTIQICNDYEFEAPLDQNGNITGGDLSTFAWPNDQIIPDGTYYMVKVYAEDGELAWGPNAVFILSSPEPFNVSAWVPSNPV